MSPKTRLFWITAVGMTATDQISKALVRATIDVNDRVSLIPNLFALWHRENPGAAFGLLRNFEYRIPLFAVIAMIAFGVIGYYLRGLPPRDRWGGTALGMLIAGALGNLIDRLFVGRVTDFLDIYVGWQGKLRAFLIEHVDTSHYNTFNVADIAIVVGVLMILVQTMRQGRKGGGQAKGG